MIKLILIALWACAVTLGSSWAVMSWKSAKAVEQEAGAEPEKAASGLEEVRTRPISVPIIAEGAIQGYVVAQFSFNIDSKIMKHMSIKPEAILLNEAFKVIYGGDTVDFRHLKRQDLPGLLATIGANVNKRFGAPIVEDVLIQELNYVPKAEARMGNPG